MSEKNKKRLKAIKTIYGEKAYHKGEKVTYGTTVYVAWWILGYNTIEELEAKYTDEKINVHIRFFNIGVSVLDKSAIFQLCSLYV